MRRTAVLTTTFKQVINSETYSVTIPMNRVETIINRVDRLIEKKKFAKALETITPFIGAAAVTQQACKPNSIEAIIEEFRDQGRYVVMDKLIATGMAKSSAYYRARKAGL
jgi:hypothetical protein